MNFAPRFAASFPLPLFRLCAPCAPRIGMISAGIFALATASTGCGGGGGGGTPGGTNNPSATPPPINTPTLSRASVTITWAARSRAVSAPASALSAVVFVSGANAGVADTSLIINRDPAQLSASSITQTLPAALPEGAYPVTVAFYSQAGGAGTLVAQATRTVSLSGATPDLGDFALSGTVASVEVAPKQTLVPGATVDVTYTPLDASGAAIAGITPGSAFVNLVSGQNALQISGGRLVGLAPGLAQVTVSLDGKTSAPQSIGVGQANVVLAASGARGQVTVSDQITRSNGGITAATYGQVGSRATVPFVSGWFDQNAASAPAGFGDSAFDHWELNGQTVSSQPTFVFAPADRSGAFAGGVLTAAYTPRPMPSGGFSPQFNQSDNVRWNAAKFPLRVHLADSSLQPRIARGFDWWVKATGGAVSYTFVSDPATADISITVGAAPSTGTGEAAVTAVTYDTDTDEIMTAKLTFTSDAPTLVDPRGDILTALSAHEFGHLLGLISQNNQGHSPNALDTMYFKPNLQVGAVTERDVNSLENLYPALFGGTNAAPGRGVSVPQSTKSTGKTATITVN